MKYCEASFAKSDNGTITCEDLSTKIAQWVQDGGVFIYYLCDLHLDLLKQAEPAIYVEEYIDEGK